MTGNTSTKSPKDTVAEIAEEPAGPTSLVRPRGGATKASVVPNPPKAVKSAKAMQKRAVDVRARVIQAAIESFGLHGFEGTSTRAVAEQAGVKHTLALYHFKSKDQLWLSTMDHVLHSYAASLDAAFENADQVPARDVLQRFIEAFVRLSARYPQVHRIMTMEGNNETPRLIWVIDNYLRDHFARVRDLIKRGQAEGSVRDCDAARLYYYIIGGGGTPYTLSVEYRELTGRDVFSEAEIYRNIAFLFDTVFV